MLLDIIPLRIDGLGALVEKFGKNRAKADYLGALMMGAVFALAFCPYSGVLYFGMLIPLTMTSPQGLWLPPIYAVATGLPVIVFAWVICSGSRLKIAGLAISPIFGSNYLPLKTRLGSK